ncbi:MAG: hypothetical protein ABSB49_08500 [Polyangia bacterium]|jgi:hypothetical protein
MNRIKAQEGTMQLRHIRPGSLEWQDAKAGEIEEGIEQLTPEEVGRLRKLASRPGGAHKEDELRRTQVQ